MILALQLEAVGRVKKALRGTEVCLHLVAIRYLHREIVAIKPPGQLAPHFSALVFVSFRVERRRTERDRLDDAGITKLMEPVNQVGAATGVNEHSVRLLLIEDFFTYLYRPAQLNDSDMRFRVVHFASRPTHNRKSVAAATWINPYDKGAARADLRPAGLAHQFRLDESTSAAGLERLVDIERVLLFEFLLTIDKRRGQLDDFLPAPGDLASTQLVLVHQIPFFVARLEVVGRFCCVLWRPVPGDKDQLVLALAAQCQHGLLVKEIARAVCRGLMDYLGFIFVRDRLDDAGGQVAGVALCPKRYLRPMKVLKRGASANRVAAGGAYPVSGVQELKNQLLGVGLAGYRRYRAVVVIALRHIINGVCRCLDMRQNERPHPGPEDRAPVISGFDVC